MKHGKHYMEPQKVSELILTEGQEEAMTKFMDFLLNPLETMFVLSGYAGTGKSTLVKYLLESVPKIMQTLMLIDPNRKNMAIQLTATTNKAADVLGEMVGDVVPTIHSYLGLSVYTDYKTGVTSLKDRTGTEIYNTLVFIDEASFVDRELLSLITKKCVQSKVIFIGDAAQLAPVKSTHIPVFNAGFPTAQLTEVMRQAKGNPIIELATKFRNTVNTGEFFNFNPDGIQIRHMGSADFKNAIETEFLDPTWSHNRSKILAWTNKRVTQYNNHICELLVGTSNINVGDYCVLNKHITVNRKSLATDSIVYITGVGEDTQMYGVDGKHVQLNHEHNVFVPSCWTETKKQIAKWRKEGNYHLCATADNWADLRATYACTVNKSQGSTYDKVFIDLSDISRCNSGNQIARMLYVAVSRARHEVIFTGDFV